MDKLFGKYPIEGVVINDKSLAQVMSLKALSVPHTFARHKKKKLGKMEVNIVERLINKLLRAGTGSKTSGKVIRTHGGLQGKKLRVMGIVEDAFAIVEEKTKENPVQVLVKALENSAPNEDVTRVSHGGVSYQIAVDVSATRRLDLALRNITLASLIGTFNKKKKLSASLADEIVFTAKGDLQNSYAMRKKDEIERVARSAR
ncbi:MAG: 30S ribosomal protein S7 [Candidatus Micrarchaeota archaeon]